MINRSDSLARGDSQLLREILNTFHSSSLYKKRKCQHLAVIVWADWTISSFVRSEALELLGVLCVWTILFSQCRGSSFIACCGIVCVFRKCDWSVILNFHVLLNEITPDCKTAAIFSFPISSKLNFFTSTKTILWESYVGNRCAVLQFFCGMLEYLHGTICSFPPKWDI